MAYFAVNRNCAEWKKIEKNTFIYYHTYTTNWYTRVNLNKASLGYTYQIYEMKY